MVTVKPISKKSDIKKFIEFNYQLYKNHPYAVPELYSDLMNTFTPGKNAGLEFSDLQLFLAYKDGKIAGRVAGIINNRANNTWNVQNVRFGWIDFIDDKEVSAALLKAVEDWGREKGMKNIQGPMGITDMDREGMLIEGFDRLGTMSTHYNYPYYQEHMAAHGYEKEIDWVERFVKVPDSIPDKYARVTELTQKRYNLRIKKLKGMKEIKDGYGQKIFDLINDAYAPLFGYSRMTQKQIDQLVASYLPLLDMRMLTLVESVENDELLAVGISMPSIVRALQKSSGKLFPFGWFHLLKSLKWKHEEGVELLLIAVKPEWQNRGINALLFSDLIPVYQQMGFKWAETNPQLETNDKSQAQWAYLEHEVPKRRRCWQKTL